MSLLLTPFHVASSDAISSVLAGAQVAAIDAQWGVEMSREYTGDLKAMYNHYLTSLMPLAEVPLGCSPCRNSG